VAKIEKLRTDLALIAGDTAGTRGLKASKKPLLASSLLLASRAVIRGRGSDGIQLAGQ